MEFRSADLKKNIYYNYKSLILLISILVTAGIIDDFTFIYRRG